MILDTLTITSVAQYWQMAQQQGFAAALWRLPKVTNKEFLIDMSGQINLVKTDLEDLPAGFVMSPFLNEDQQKTRFLQADVYLNFDAQQQLSYKKSYGLELAKPYLEANVKDERFVKSDNPTSSKVVENENTRATFLDNVSQAIVAIKAQDFQKVVISKTKAIALSTDFELLTSFDKLCEAYPNAFVSLVFLPEQNEFWLGASPEILVSVDAQGIFRTVSLAGTQPVVDSYGDSVSLSEARWSQKEIEEQSFVSRYIIECFKKIRLREYIENGPKTVQAGNLLHLRTDYWVDTKAVNFPQLGTVMLELLHPTSAVCGMPKPAALAFILANEPHQRHYYSGYLGPVNINSQSHLFVNLRTMKIKDRQAIVYAGAGITEDSNPTKEWRETEFKCQTLLGVIH
jgi:isochorismate synthase